MTAQMKIAPNFIARQVSGLGFGLFIVIVSVMTINGLIISCGS